MSHTLSRYKQLKANSLPATRDSVNSSHLVVAIQLFSIDLNAVVGNYSLGYVLGHTKQDVDYLLSKLEDWTKDRPSYTILLMRESTCVNDLTCFMLEEGEYIAVDMMAFNNVLSDYRTYSPVYKSKFIKRLVTRVELASILAPLSIVETTEADIRSFEEAYDKQASMQRQALQKSRGSNQLFGNMQNNPFGC